MINIYKIENNQKIILTEEISKNCWINLVNPSIEEINNVIKKTNIDEDMLIKLLDEEELPRIMKRDDETLIVLDLPYIVDNNIKHKYKTNPLGIIMSDKGYLITISLKEQNIIDEFKNKEIFSFDFANKLNFVLQLLITASKLYQKELANINTYINNKEKVLYHSTNNKELIELLNVEKTLVYFTTSLKANDVILEKIAKGLVTKMTKENQELLEDAIIENRQAIEMATIYREILTSMTDTYATIISNNLNDVMKFLASITIVCSIPTMVASFIGMNVPLGEIGSSPASFILIILASLLLSIIIALILRKKNML